MLPSRFAVMIAPAIFFGTAASAEPFYDAALCKPPYTTDSATTLYEAAEAQAKPDTSMMTAYVYTLPKDLGQDGFKTREVVFAGSSVGVLIQGQQADALAERYHLERERSSLLGASSKGYARALPADQQPQPEAGIVSIVARESPSLSGKTLLACEFVSKEDREALDAFEKSSGQ
jgi:acetyl-CoA acetyltransferase